jgi:O-antigen/teichoic acid export membrane protein
MSRFHNFQRNLTLSYTQLAVNVVYVLISVPLVLYWLPKEEFGLWALLIQLMGFFSLVDLGMTTATGRLLVDYKDRRKEGGYGALVKTAFWVSAVQGLIILVIILFSAPLLAAVIDIPSLYKETFISLMRLQGVITALLFSMRPLGLILYAHQRLDICTYNEIGSLVCQLVLLWVCLAAGQGLFSFVYAGAFYAFIGPGYLFWKCKRMGLWPDAGEWGKASWSVFLSVFRFGKDVFLMTLGRQLTLASQTVIVSRTLGLESAAVWAVGTKMLNLVIPLISRPFGTALPGLSEMLVRGEVARLRARFSGIVELTASLGVVLGISLALCNSLFVQVWTQGAIVWLPWNDVLLGIWVVLLSLQATHGSFVSVTKDIGGMRYVFFLEGCCFVLVAILVGPVMNYSGVVGASIVCAALFSYQYSLSRSIRYFKCTVRELAFGWVRRSLKLALVYTPLAVLVWFATRGFPPLVRLEVHVMAAVVVGGLLFFRLGLSPELLDEMRRRWPVAKLRWFRLVLG